MVIKLFKGFNLIFSKFKLDYIFVFIILIIFFSWVQGNFTLPEPDSFYHAKIAEYLSQGKVLNQFPWLQETNLAEKFVDHHFLYHLILVPFVVLFEPLVGVKIATIILASLFLFIIYWLFKKFKIYLPFIYLVLIPLSFWLFRANLVKAPIAFFILLLLAYYFLEANKFIGLGAMAFLSVWLYAGWPILLAMVLIYLLACLFLEAIKTRGRSFHKIRLVGLFKDFRGPWKAAAAAFIGILAGLAINPYFPNNLGFYWTQIVKIALVNYHKIIDVGNEWNPSSIYTIITTNPLICSLLITGILLFVLSYKKQTARALTWGILAVAFLALTLKSQRNIEFFIPVAVIFFAFGFDGYLKTFPKPDLRKIFSFRPLTIASVFLTVLIFNFLFIAPFYLVQVKKQLLNGFTINHFQAVSLWLKDHAPDKSIIFNASWSDFPFLFYYNDSNYYLSGLDPTFMYEKSKDKYWLYRDVTSGGVKNNLAIIIKHVFKADYVVLEPFYEEFNKNLEASESFEMVYKDDEAVVYEVVAD